MPHLPFAAVSYSCEDVSYKDGKEGISLAVQWLRLRASTAGGTVSIPGQGTKIPHAV